MKISISKVKIKATVMSIKIGIGKLRIGTGGSQSWESTCAPTNLTATVISSTQIDLNWDESCPDEDGFIIEKSTDGITYTPINYVLADVTYYSDKTCVSGVVYYYRVRAFQLSGTYNSEVEILSMLTTIDTAQLVKLNTLVAALKTGLSVTNLSDYFDFFDIFGNETSASSLFNLVKNQHYPVLGSASPTFTAYEGWQGNASTQYIDLNYNPSTEGVNFKINDGAIGIYSRTDSNGAECDMGSRDAANNDIMLIARTSGKAYSRINNGSLVSVNGANANGTGLYIATRNGQLITDLYLYKNKTSLADVSGLPVSTIVPSVNIWALARNANGVISAPSSRQLSLVFASKHISTAHRDVIVDAFEAYMVSNGKGVI